jgi:hypothetical protein
VWLCQNCAKLVDNDPTRFTSHLLRQWKSRADETASKEVGQSALDGSTDAMAEQQIQHKLRLRSAFEQALLRPASERRGPPSRHPYAKFRVGDVIVRSLLDQRYPEMDQSPGISNWFRLELFDFYHNGLEFILAIRRGAIDRAGRWKVLSHAESAPENWKEVKLWEIGRIPYRNIRAYDLKGDEYYNFPHLYCAFAEDGEPYEQVRYSVVGEGDEYDWPLEASRQDL